MAETPNPPARQPLAYDTLEPLSADKHGPWRLRSGDFDYARETPFIPIIVGEFAKASRTYPIVFSADDPSPLALLGLDRQNLFVRDGVWESEPVGAGERPARTMDAYIPAYVRRYPFGYLRITDTTEFVLGIDPNCEYLCTDGTEGEPLFEDGKPSALVRTALAFCDVFQGEAESTMEFVRALAEKDLLLERRFGFALSDGRKHSLSGLRIVDRTKFDRLDGPTVVEWHSKGWLQAIAFHLASLDLLHMLARREVSRTEAAVDPALEPAA